MPGRRRRRAPEPRPMNDLIGRAITAAAEPSANIRDQVAELGGTHAVAALTGRSERTIRRWAQNNHVPARGDAAQAFDAAVTAHRDSPAYRRGRVNHRRDTRMRNNGATVKYQGVAGPISDILDAYYAGGEAAAIDALGEAMAAEYMGSTQYGWTFQDDATNLQFLRHRF